MTFFQCRPKSFVLLRAPTNTAAAGFVRTAPAVFQKRTRSLTAKDMPGGGDSFDRRNNMWLPSASATTVPPSLTNRGRTSFGRRWDAAPCPFHCRRETSRLSRCPARPPQVIATRRAHPPSTRSRRRRRRRRGRRSRLIDASLVLWGGATKRRRRMAAAALDAVQNGPQLLPPLKQLTCWYRRALVKESHRWWVSILSESSCWCVGRL